MPVLEGKWDCAQCRTVGIPGLTTRCPACGDSRNEHLDPEEAPYLPSDARVLTSAAELDYAASGPSWNCGSCGTLNRGDTETCVDIDCKKPKDHDDRVNPAHTYVDGVDAEGVTVSDAGQVELDWVDATLQSSDKLQQLEDGPVVTRSRTFAASDLPRQGVLAVRDAVRNARTVPRPGFRIVLAPFIIALCVGMIGLLAYVGYANFIKTDDVTLTVQSLSWERQVEIEEFRTLTREGWNHPGDARVISSRQAVHHHDRVFDHYEDKTRQVSELKQDGTRPESYQCGSTTVDNGNGTFGKLPKYCDRQVPVYKTVYKTEHYKEPVYKQVPVYRTKYVYNVDRWVTDYFERASGSEGPYWPEATGLQGKQRIGNERHESYTITLADEKGRTFNREASLKTWSLVHAGDKLQAEQTRRGSVRNIAWPTS